MYFCMAGLRVMAKYFYVADTGYSCFPNLIYHGKQNKPTFSVCSVLKLLEFYGGCAGVALCRTLDVKQGITHARQARSPEPIKSLQRGF